MSFNMKYFEEEEFKCHCCGQVKINQDLIIRLNIARAIAGIPFVITSGYRCEKHNTAVGSTSDNHTKGVAVDIQCTLGHDRLRILTSLLTAGFKRIGVGPSFIHADINNLAPSVWLYPGR